jgi:hypothetical protein
MNDVPSFANPPPILPTTALILPRAAIALDESAPISI